ncbi:hypothetical protein [Brevibacterium casei]
MIVMPLLLARFFLIAESPMKPKMIAAMPKIAPMPKTKARTTPTMPPMRERMPQMFFEVFPPVPDE